MNDFIGSVLIWGLVLFFWLGSAFIVSFVAAQKGRTAVGFFFIAVLFSFFVGILTLIALPEKNSLQQQVTYAPTNTKHKEESQETKPEILQINSLIKPQSLITSLVALAVLVIVSLIYLSSAIGKNQGFDYQEKYTWTSAVKECGVGSEFYIDGKTIDLYESMPIENKVCILRYFSSDAASEIAKDPGLISIPGQEFSDKFSDGFLEIYGTWVFSESSVSGKWTITN